MAKRITLEDMQRESGLSKRTLHSYMQKGLIPGPEKAGRYAYYSKEHLYLLELITRLKDLHLPLEKIRKLTKGLSPKQIQWLNEGKFFANIIIPNFEDEIADIKDFKEENKRSIDYIVKLEIIHKIFDKIKEKSNLFVDESENSVFDEFKILSDSDNIIKKYHNEIWHHFTFQDGLEIKIKIADKKIDKNKLVEIFSLIKDSEISKE